MRYLALVEYGPDDVEEVWKTYDETTVVRETTPNKFPKILLESHNILGELPRLTENFRIFNVLEADDPQQLEDMLAHWLSKASEMKTHRIYLVPITETPSLGSKIQSKTRERSKTSQ